MSFKTPKTALKLLALGAAALSVSACVAEEDVTHIFKNGSVVMLCGSMEASAAAAAAATAPDAAARIDRLETTGECRSVAMNAHSWIKGQVLEERVENGAVTRTVGMPRGEWLGRAPQGAGETLYVNVVNRAGGEGLWWEGLERSAIDGAEAPVLFAALSAG